ncbi:GNAT family N-acetyltransferase [Thauera butanivorans]|uniref:GNAT family N-acetyltransferase n=1 Tax=Thauera butanivorans TaxID=86174 RepID=UPI0008391101|nr:GNAT family N-acetyltransferase [Thauera butanivorans]
MPLSLTLQAIAPLERAHERSAFDCGNEALNRYLKLQARQDAQRHVAATFVLFDDKRVVCGFYSLSASLIPIAELPPALVRKLPRYDHLPVTLLGRLAVDRSVRGQGAGQFLLVDALRRSLEGAQHVGAMAVIVDAKDQQAESFYRHFDFLPFQQTPLRLFLPMAQVAQLFSVPRASA